MGNGMVDKIIATNIFLLLVVMGPLQAQTVNNAGTHDSIANAAKTPAVQVEDNLNLDDSEAVLAPVKKTSAPVPSADTVKNLLSPGTALPAASATVNVVPAPNKPPAPAPAADTVKNLPSPGTVLPAAPASTTSPQAGKSPETVKDSFNKAGDEDLILEGGEEDLLDQAKVAQKKAAGTKISASPFDSAHGALNPATLSPGTAGPAKSPSTIPTPGSLTVSNSQAAPAAELPVPATIEQVHSLNFARNLKEYRSPKLAMLMSLILPGSGELYAQSDIWATGFVVAEAALIATGASLASTATKKKQAAYTYAGQHYKDTSMKAYLDSLHAYLHTKGEDSLFYQAIFTDSSDQTFLKQAGTKSSTYYNLINLGPSSPFIRGWDDVTPAIFTRQGGFQLDSIESTKYFKDTSGNPDSSYLLKLVSDSTTLLFGQSAHQQVYNGMIQSSLQWSNYSRSVFLTLIINHIVSAITAGILAKKHNDELLGQQSFWQHIGVDVSYVNTGSQTVPSYALQVKF
jgi:hypothetical protein